MNAIKHSFAGQTCILHSHEIDAFREHFESFRKEYRPCGPTEEFLVQSLSEISWSTQPIRTASTNLMTLAGSFIAKDLNTYGIYENRKMRLFNTTRKELLQIQSERKANEKAELEEAALYRKLCKLNQDPAEQPWHPKDPQSPTDHQPRPKVNTGSPGQTLQPALIFWRPSRYWRATFLSIPDLSDSRFSKIIFIHFNHLA